MVKMSKVTDGVATAATVAFVGLAPAAPAAISQIDAPQPVNDAAIEVIDKTHDAVVEGVQGRTRGEEAANAEPVAEAESSETSDPPDGWTMGWSSWTGEGERGPDTESGDTDPGEVADIGDASADGEGFGDA
jgi:hypothetical protein